MDMRFIPAGAGNTKTGAAKGSQREVHPRGCGEHLSISRLELGNHGSSPRVRGTRGTAREGFNVGRFIPAGAGNTLPFIASTGWSPVHPRGCGEHGTRPACMEEIHGSSPRVRGTLEVVGQEYH